MTGYKIPEGWAIGWRNAIERYPKDSEYAWGMNAVLESIEAFPLEELDENPWHTGTPTEEGWYLFRWHDDKERWFTIEYLTPEGITEKDKWGSFNNCKWQKIEEKQDGQF